MGYPLVDVDAVPGRGRSAAQLPLRASPRALRVLPLLMRDGRLVVALDDPSRRAALDEIEFVAA